MARFFIAPVEAALCEGEANVIREVPEMPVAAPKVSEVIKAPSEINPLPARGSPPFMRAVPPILIKFYDRVGAIPAAEAVFPSRARQFIRVP